VLEHAELIVLSLPSAAALDQLVSGDGGLLAHPRSGAVLAETSTFALADKHRARELLAEAQMVLLDCPISGTGGQARARDIVFFGSGPRDAFDRIAPALAATSREVAWVGEFGAGTKVKFVSNLMVAVHTMAAAEAINLARSVGLDVDTTFRLLTAGASTSRMLEVRGPMMVADDFPGDSATLHTLSKDVGLILDFAGDADVPTPLLSVVSTFFAAARAHGLLGADPAVVARVLAVLSSSDRSASDRPEESS
jgi:L-threonate 2-dehydrogenase